MSIVYRFSDEPVPVRSCKSTLCCTRLIGMNLMQDVLEVAIGKFVLSINVIKVQQAAPQGYFVPDQPIVCHVDNPLEGVHLLGSHHGDVTDLAVSSIPSFRVASASQDGTVRTSLPIQLHSKHWIGPASELWNKTLCLLSLLDANSVCVLLTNICGCICISGADMGRQYEETFVKY